MLRYPVYNANGKQYYQDPNPDLSKPNLTVDASARAIIHYDLGSNAPRGIPPRCARPQSRARKHHHKPRQHAKCPLARRYDAVNSRQEKSSGNANYQGGRYCNLDQVLPHHDSAL